MRIIWGAMRGLLGWVRATGLEMLGWLLVVTGIAALVLPGPGMLMMVAGLAVLSNRYEWARRSMGPIRTRAFDAARYGVATWPRIVFSTLCALGAMSLGVIWWIGPTIPEVGPFGDELPFQGWGTGLSMVLSACIALLLIVYSFRRFRNEDLDEDELDERVAEHLAEERAAQQAAEEQVLEDAERELTASERELTASEGARARDRSVRNRSVGDRSDDTGAPTG